MTGLQTPQTWLADYARNGSDWAFRQLVSAYLNFVYSTALRLVDGDTHFAEDISQTVFADLARKARTLPEDVKLGGWLHRHTCFVARKALRRERRRQARERRAVELQLIEDYTADNVGQLAAVLDEAINDLRAQDRSAITLRFFEQRDFRAIGDALNSSEDAARMRVSRALERLGRLLRRRGVTISLAGLGFVLGTKVVSAAPAGLASNLSTNALAGAAQSPPLLALLRQACGTKLNLGILSAAAVIALVAVLLSVFRSEARTQLPALQVAAAQPAEPPDEEPTESLEPTTEPDSPRPAEAPAATGRTPASSLLPSPAPANPPGPLPVARSAPSPLPAIPPARPAVNRATDFRAHSQAPAPALAGRSSVIPVQRLNPPRRPNIIRPGLQSRSALITTNPPAALQPWGRTQPGVQQRVLAETPATAPLAPAQTPEAGLDLSGSYANYATVNGAYYRGVVSGPQRIPTSAFRGPATSSARKPPPF